MSDRYAEVGRLEAEVARRAALMYRQWWRVFRNRRLRAECRDLFAQLAAEHARIDALPKSRRKVQPIGWEAKL